MNGGTPSAPWTAPDSATIEMIARDVLARLPAPFATHLDGVLLRVEDFAEDEILAELGLDNPFDLTGLYQGRPVGEKSSLESGALPDMIFLYRRALLDEWIETGVALDALVTHVVIHEVGHHFGLSDDDMHALEELAG